MLVFNYWIPLSERGRFVGFAYTGVTFGIIMGFTTGGLLCVHGGWETLFYFSGKKK